MTRVVFPAVYPIIDEVVAEAHGWAISDLGTALFDGGATLVQLRCPRYSLSRFLACADDLVERASSYDARVIINDRIDIATLSGASGVHVGQNDLHVPLARRLLTPGAVVGLSTHTTEQLAESRLLDIDYVAVGPIYETTTKATGYPALGVGAVQSARAVIESLPVIAIGGITLDNALDVLAVGATSVAIISDIFSAGDPTQRTRAYVERLAV